MPWHMSINTSRNRTGGVLSRNCALELVYGRILYMIGIKVYIIMGLNIKNEETHRLVEELARLTGETMTAAVTEAVRQRLDRIRRERDGGLADRLLTIGKDCAARLKEPYRSADHGDLLYDERGLPR
jgi:antitoxin VapB